MRQIQSIIWDNQTATQLLVTVITINDNGCSFAWELFTVDNQLIDTGDMQCAGDDYTNYQADTTNFPYSFVASNIQPPLTILN